MTLPDRGSVDRRQRRLDSQSSRSCWLLMRYARLNNLLCDPSQLPQKILVCAFVKRRESKHILHLVIRTYFVSSTTSPTEMYVVFMQLFLRKFFNVTVSFSPTCVLYSYVLIFAYNNMSVPRLHTTYLTTPTGCVQYNVAITLCHRHDPSYVGPCSKTSL